MGATREITSCGYLRLEMIFLLHGDIDDSLFEGSYVAFTVMSNA
jgi:hypothetical protein